MRKMQSVFQLLSKLVFQRTSKESSKNATRRRALLASAAEDAGAHPKDVRLPVDGKATASAAHAAMHASPTHLQCHRGAGCASVGA